MPRSNFYRRKLPHWQPKNAEYFVTFRLSGSIPKSVAIRLQEEQEKNIPSQGESTQLDRQRQIFKKYEKLLDSGTYGPHWLKNERVANVLYEALLYRDKTEYDLYAFCIMSNHVHIVFRLLEHSNNFPVTDIFRKLKYFTALKANKILNRSGSFWQNESYDRVVRNQKELGNTIHYVLNNPVKAGLINDWKEWKYNYCKSDFVE